MQSVSGHDGLMRLVFLIGKRWRGRGGNAAGVVDNRIDQ